MRRDLARLRRRRKRGRKMLVLLILCAFVAMAMVTMRACSDQFSQPYNKDYKPMDIQRQGENPPEK